MKLLSPNTIQAAACAWAGFKTPSTPEDWEKCVNFWACNIATGLEESACVLMAAILECPLSPAHIQRIAAFQADLKKRSPE